MGIFLQGNGTTADSLLLLWGSQAGHPGQRHGIQKNQVDLPKSAKSYTMSEDYSHNSYRRKRLVVEV